MKKMKKTKKMRFSDIHSIEDIRKQKARLKKKISSAEESIGGKTDIGKLLLNATSNIKSSFSESDGNIEILGDLLPIGMKYLTRQIKKNINKKKFRRFLIYATLGSATAYLAYRFIQNRKDESVPDLEA